MSPVVSYPSGVTAEDYLLAHKSLRNKFMSDAEIAEAELMLDWYRESWYAKDANGLFDLWDLIDKYWSGEANSPVYPDDIGSNTNFINPYIEGQVALSWRDPVAAYVKAVDPSDTFYKRDAQAILDFIVRENNVHSLRDNIYRRLKKNGITVCTVFWDKAALNGKGVPRFRNWNIRHVFFDPTIIDPQDFQDSRFTILQTFKSLVWAHETFGEEKASAITPGYHPVEGQWDLGSSQDWHDYELENTSYIHLYVMTRRNSNDKVRLIQMSADGVVLDEKNLIDRTYPVFFTEQMRCEEHLYGKATVAQLLSLQDAFNDFDDQVRRNARLFGNPQKIVSNSSGIDVDSWTNEEGLVVTANDVKDAYDIVKPQPVSPDVIRRMNEIKHQDRVIVGRFTDYMTGVAQSGIDTATEAASLQSTGMAIVDSDKRKVQTMFADMLKYALKLAEEYWTTEMAFRVTGEEDFIHMRPCKLKEIPVVAPATREYIAKATKKAADDYAKQQKAFGVIVPKGALPPGWEPPKYMIYKKNGKEVPREATFDIEVDFGADIPSNKAFLLNAIREAYLAKAVDPVEYRQVLHDLRALPYIDSDKEQEIVDRIRAMQEALVQKEEAAAASVLMNAMANNGIPPQGVAPVAQGVPGGTPMPDNPLASVPNPQVPGLTGVGRAANPATQNTLALTGV